MEPVSGGQDEGGGHVGSAWPGLLATTTQWDKVLPSGWSLGEAAPYPGLCTAHCL